MTVKDIMHSVCNDRGMSLREAAQNIGVSPGSLWNQLDRQDGMRVRLETLIRYFGELECEIYIVDSMTEEEYLLDGEDDDIRLNGSRNYDNAW